MGVTLPASMRLSDLLTQRLLRGVVRRQNNLRIAHAARQVARMAPDPKGQPIAFFKASTGIDDLSWNSGFHLLASWALRLRGIPVVYFACRRGMSRCVLGTSRDAVHRAPPCRSCIYQSSTLYAGVPAARDFGRTVPSAASQVQWFTFDRDSRLEAALQGLSLESLIQFVWPPSGDALAQEGDSERNPATGAESAPTEWPKSLALGTLCLPGLRWILRLHTLDDDEDTRFLLREYMLSAWNVAQQFSRFLDATKPRAVVVFNGQFFPEATARYVALQRGIRVITHEVGLQPASAFFTDGEATAYPMHMPDDFELSAVQNARLDAYLEQRFQGKFIMAGIQFWPTIRGLDAAFVAKAERFRQIVPIFTNVVFDTSQPHANTVFADMFGWLGMCLDVIRSHPESLFVIRAHPDETRTRKESRETVQGWVEENRVDRLENVVFIAPKEYLSSYELIQRSKFVMVYNSTIGLEASIMGKPVLCGGRARFTQYPTVRFPQTVEAQRRTLEDWLTADAIDVPAEYKRNARRFLYYQLFRTSLPFGEFLTPSVRTTQARLKFFDFQRLLNAGSMRAILRGLLEDGDFLLEEATSA